MGAVGPTSVNGRVANTAVNVKLFQNLKDAKIGVTAIATSGPASVLGKAVEDAVSAKAAKSQRNARTGVQLIIIIGPQSALGRVAGPAMHAGAIGDFRMATGILFPVAQSIHLQMWSWSSEGGP